LFLASKVEECPINIKSILSEISGLRIDLSIEMSDILDAELLVLQDLDFSLIVFHPYPLLDRYLADMGHADCLSMAWSVMNDLYKNSIILGYSPHSLAVGVIFFVLVFKNVELTDSWWSGDRFNSVEAACIIQNLLIVYNEMKD
jgi:cyclin C